MTTLKIAILVVITISLIANTVFTIRKSSKKEEKRLILISGIVGLIGAVVILLVTFSTYVFLSWNKIILIVGEMLICVCIQRPILQPLSGFILVGVLLSVLVISPSDYCKVELNEVSTQRTIYPTIDPIRKTNSLGYQVDDKGKVSYFFLENKNESLSKKLINEPTIYYISSKENTYVVEKTIRKTYVLSEKKNQEQQQEIISEYILYINSDQIYLINDF